MNSLLEHSRRLVQRTKRLGVNLFIGFHRVAIACWCAPLDNPLIPLCRNLVQPYFLFSGPKLCRVC
jgi:hypothetical protein